MVRAAVASALLLLVLAVGAAPAGASAAKLTLSEGGVALVPGQNVYGEEGQLYVEPSQGWVECSFGPEVELYSSLATNSKASDELRVTGVHEREAECRSYTGNVEVALDSLGSTLKINTKGKATVGQDPTLELLFEHVLYQGNFHPNISCVYQRGSLHGTSTATPTREPLQIGLEGTLSLRAASSSPEAHRLCPADAEVSVAFAMDGETGAIEEQT
jgi:hypothetical protein